VKVARRKLRIYEVGISYWGRTYEEGKKIGWKDGVRALYWPVEVFTQRAQRKSCCAGSPGPRSLRRFAMNLACCGLCLFSERA